MQGSIAAIPGGVVLPFAESTIWRSDYRVSGVGRRHVSVVESSGNERDEEDIFTNHYVLLEIVVLFFLFLSLYTTR